MIEPPKTENLTELTEMLQRLEADYTKLERMKNEECELRGTFDMIVEVIDNAKQDISCAIYYIRFIVDGHYEDVYEDV